VSVACNIVEGCARRTKGEYLHFINVALASATETRYLIGLAYRLELLSGDDIRVLAEDTGSYLRSCRNC
jgi:four helix bundle protein